MPLVRSRRVFLASSLVPLLGLRSAPGVEDGPALAPFDDLFTQFLKDNAVPGAGVAVSRGDQLVYARGFGYADVETTTPARADSLFRIASISKPITAVAILQLVERGRVALDEPALRHVKLKPFSGSGAKHDERWQKITIRHCLQHTGGWDRDAKGSFDPIAIPGRITRELKLRGAPTPEDVVRFMLGRPLDFDPGARFAYSNLGYLVLGRVIESVTGQKYESWVREHVLAPAGITAMGLGRGLPQCRARGEVSYYDSKKRTGSCLYPPRVGEPVPLPDGANNIEGYEAHGGWIASAVDLVRFACALDSGKNPLLSRRSLQTMSARPGGLAGSTDRGEPKASFYGCGWSIRPVGKTGEFNAWHNGLIPGTSTLLVRRHDGLNWAVLFNTEANPEGKILAGLIDGPMHEAAAKVRRWPAMDLFKRFSMGT